MSYYACNKINYSIAFSIFLRYTHHKASVYNLFSNNLKINGGRTDSLCFSRNFFKSKEQRDSGSFRPFVKITLRQREGIIIGKKDMGTKNLMNYPDVFADIGNVNLFSGKVVLQPEELEPLPTDLIGKAGREEGIYKVAAGR